MSGIQINELFPKPPEYYKQFICKDSLSKQDVENLKIQSKKIYNFGNFINVWLIIKLETQLEENQSHENNQKSGKYFIIRKH